MLYHGFRNIALLSGFAWKTADGRWVLRQREPLAMALPLELGPGVREPENCEAIDVVGHLVARVTGPVLLATHLDRAAASSFPLRLHWKVSGIDSNEPLIPGQHVTKYWRDVVDGQVDVSDEILKTLRDRPSVPDDVREVLSRDPETEKWCNGTAFPHRLTNFVMLTGLVGKSSPYANRYVTPYYNVDLQTEAPPAPPLPMRLTQDVYAMERARRDLRPYSMVPTTFHGTFVAKVKPDGAGGVAEVSHCFRIAGVIAAYPDDFEGIPAWAPAWRAASRPRATEMASTPVA